MAFNRKAFFDKVRQRPFKGSITPSQFSGMSILLDVWEDSFRQRTPITQLAVCLATTYHETGHTMQPIRELGGSEYLRLNYDVTGRNPERAKRMGNVRAGDGVKFCGRGDVQLTWFVNYQKATKRLRELGHIGADVDFTVTPDKVMEPRIAALIMFLGMEEGWFTGKTLDQLVDPNVDGDEHADAVRSRAIINGSDRAELIAGYADDFLAALIAAEKSGPVPDAPKPTPVNVPAPAGKPETPAPASKAGGIVAFLALLWAGVTASLQAHPIIIGGGVALLILAFLAFLLTHKKV